MPNVTSNEVRDDAWQRAYLLRLGDIVTDMLDNADDVPTFLASDKLPADHRPSDILSDTSAQCEEAEAAE